MTSADTPSSGAPDPSRVRLLFDASCDLPAAQWDAVFAAHDANAAERRATVALLERDRGTPSPNTRARDFLLSPVASVLGRMASQDVRPGDRLGPWRVGEKIGEGGMGQVFRASREDGQFTQIAALKVLSGLPTGEALDRLALERQVLAALSHPNIARLIDGGTTPKGRPYLVMDFIDGEDIESYCVRVRPGLRQRVALLREICLAVAYAHQHLTLHCDLKPSNIIVDKTGRPVLLDFGIAQLVTTSDTAGAPATPAGFTPRFSSPEQQAGAPLTTATDVYSLGQLIEHVVLDAAHALERDELMAVVTRATARLPAERYRNPDALAEELQRFLDRIPLEARPDRMGYVARKLLQRRWGSVAVALAFSLTAAALTASALWQRDRAMVAEAAARAELERTRIAEGNARRERDRAQGSETRAIAREREAENAREQAQSERDKARRAEIRAQSETQRAIQAEASALLEAQKVGAVRDFLVSLFSDMNQSPQGARKLLASDLLEQGRQRAEKELSGQPELNATMLLTLARIYERIGDLRQARALYSATVDAERKLGGRPLIEAEALARLALVLSNDGAHKTAEPHAREALALRIRHAGEDSLQAADSHSILALTLSGLGNHQDAQDHASRSLTIRERTLGPDAEAVAAAHHNLGQVQAQAGQFDASIESYRRALKIKQALFGDRHANTLSSVEGLGQTLRRAKRLAEAEPLLVEAVNMQRELNGSDSSRFAAAADSLANLLHDMGRVREARNYYQQALAVMELTPENATSLRAAFYANNLANALEDLCEYAAAEMLYRKSIAIREKHWKREDPGVVRARANLGRALNRGGKSGEAAEVFADVLAVREQSLPAGHLETLDARLGLLESLVKQGDTTRARAAWPTIAKAAESLSGPRLANFQRIAALFHAASGDDQRAGALLKARWDAAAASGGADNPSTLAAKLDYAEVLAHKSPLEAAQLVAGLGATLGARSPAACSTASRISRVAMQRASR
jgi:eukaryotic-like serine/threonine-protein kinase